MQASLGDAQHYATQYALAVQQAEIRIQAAIIQGTPPELIAPLRAAKALAATNQAIWDAAVIVDQWQLANLQQAYRNAGCQP